MNAIALVSLVFVLFAQSQSAENKVSGCSGCRVKGACYSANQEWTQGCWTKKCSVTTNGPFSGWKTEIVKTQCPDKDGSCLGDGQKTSDGKCTCSISGLRWSLNCQGR